MNTPNYDLSTPEGRAELLLEKLRNTAESTMALAGREGDSDRQRDYTHAAISYAYHLQVTKNIPWEEAETESWQTGSNFALAYSAIQYANTSETLNG
jgi:hypothetical protein